MLKDEIAQLSAEIKALDDRAQFLRGIRSHLRKMKKLQEIDIRLGVDKHREALLHGDNRRNKAKR